jgi:gibberellin-44 dioxygenase
MEAVPAPPLPLGAPTPGIDIVPAAANNKEAVAGSKGATSVFDLRREAKIPDPFVWPQDDTRPTSAAELDVPVVDVGALRNGDADGLRRGVAQVASACATHGFFQVCGHGVDAALARAALDGASDFFRLPLAEKQRARRVPGTVSGYTSAHADRFASKLPWKETLSFRFDDGAASPVVADYFTGTLGPDFEPMG